MRGQHYFLLALFLLIFTDQSTPSSAEAITKIDTGPGSYVASTANEDATKPAAKMPPAPPMAAQAPVCAPSQMATRAPLATQSPVTAQPAVQMGYQTLPANPDHLYKQGVKYLQSKDYNLAVASFKAALAVQRKVEYFEGLAVALAKSGDTAGAQMTLRRAINLYPFETELKDSSFFSAPIPETYGGITQATYLTPQLEQYLGSQNAKPATDTPAPEDAEQNQARPQESAEENALPPEGTEREQATQAKSISVDSVEGQSEDLIEVDAGSSQFPGQGRLELWQRACVLNTNGNRLVANGKFHEGLIQLRGAVIVYPYDPNFHHNLGVALRKEGDLDRAAVAFRDAVSLKPRDWNTWLNLGTVLYDLKRFHEAREAFLSASKASPSKEGQSNIAHYLSALSTVSDF